MLVTIQPIGREGYRLDADGPPWFSSAIDGGYEMAQVVVELDDEQRVNVLGARIRIHGDEGIMWQGVVTRRPGRGEPVVAKGWGWCATIGRREALYCDTALTPWTADPAAAYVNNGWTLGYGVATLAVAIQAGTYPSGSPVRFWRSVPTTTSLRVTGTISGLAAQTEVRLYTTTSGPGGTLRATYTTNSAFDSSSQPLKDSMTGNV